MKCAALSFVVLVVSAGCSSSSDDRGPIGCGAAACGGSVVGKWTMVSYCGRGIYESTTLGCPEPATVDITGVTMTRTEEYRTDGTYTEVETETGTLRLAYPASCLGSVMGAATCDQAIQRYAGSGATYSCTTPSGGGCDCIAQLANTPYTTDGTYSISGTELKKVPPGATVLRGRGYCVNGNRLVEKTPGGVQYVMEKVP